MDLKTVILIAIAIIIVCFILNGCTYSVNLAHTEGQATDLIDEAQTAQPDIKPNIAIPAI